MLHSNKLLNVFLIAQVAIKALLLMQNSMIFFSCIDMMIDWRISCASLGVYN